MAFSTLPKKVVRWKRLKKIVEILRLGWFFGGGLAISLGSLIWDWKLALGIFCIWAVSCIIGALVLIDRM